MIANIQQYEPIFNTDCFECGHSPCVGLRSDEGYLTSTNLCGVCFFRDRLMVDPSEWNNEREATE